MTREEIFGKVQETLVDALSVEQAQLHALRMKRMDRKIHPAAATLNHATSPQRPGLTGIAWQQSGCSSGHGSWCLVRFQPQHAQRGQAHYHRGGLTLPRHQLSH